MLGFLQTSRPDLDELNGDESNVLRSFCGRAKSYAKPGFKAAG
jgi:hypothetical protein